MSFNAIENLPKNCKEAIFISFENGIFSEKFGKECLDRLTEIYKRFNLRIDKDLESSIEKKYYCSWNSNETDFSVERSNVMGACIYTYKPNPFFKNFFEFFKSSLDMMQKEYTCNREKCSLSKILDKEDFYCFSEISKNCFPGSGSSIKVEFFHGHMKWEKQEYN